MSLKSCGRNNVQKIKQSQHRIQANFRDDVHTTFHDGPYAKLVEGFWRQRLPYPLLIKLVQGLVVSKRWVMDAAGLDVLRVVWDNLRLYADSYELVPGDSGRVYVRTYVRTRLFASRFRMPEAMKAHSFVFFCVRV